MAFWGGAKKKRIKREDVRVNYGSVSNTASRRPEASKEEKEEKRRREEERREKKKGMAKEIWMDGLR